MNWKSAGWLGVLMLAGWAVASEPPGASPGAERGPCPVSHRFLKGGWASKGVAVIGPDLAVEWGVPSADEISDAWYLADGGVVHSFSIRKRGEAGIKCYDGKKNLKWVYHVEPGRDNHSCQPLPQGCFLAGEVAKGAAYMVEINGEGKKLREVQLELSAEMTAAVNREVHHVFRQVRKTPQNTYLAASMRCNRAIEWDADGRLLREFPECHYAAVRLPNGNTLVSGKKGVIEYDAQGQEVWSMRAPDFERLNLKMEMICGIQRLPNGHTIISNVHHGSLTETGDLYRLIEVTPAKQLVWWVADPAFDGMNMGSVQVIDVAGDPAHFGVWR